jgi:hypothetical protein
LSPAVIGWTYVAAVSVITLLLLSPARLAATRARCIDNVKHLAQAEFIYADNFDERLPGRSWIDGSRPYLVDRQGADYSRCPSLAKGQYGYAMSEHLLHSPLSRISQPQRQVLIFDTADVGKNAVAAEPDFLTPARHRSVSVVYADGHTKGFRQ